MRPSENRARATPRRHPFHTHLAGSRAQQCVRCTLCLRVCVCARNPFFRRRPAGAGAGLGGLFKRLSYNAPHCARVHPSLASKSLEQETGTDAFLAKPLPKALFSISHRLWKTTCFPVPVPADLQASKHVRLARARTPTHSLRAGQEIGGLAPSKSSFYWNRKLEQMLF